MSGQQISAETALPFFRQRCSELQDETLLLRARSAELEQAKTEAEQRAANLEKQLTEARTENEQLRAAPQTAPQPLSCVDQDALP